MSDIVISPGTQRVMVIDEIDGQPQHIITINGDGLVFDDYWFQGFRGKRIVD